MKNPNSLLNRAKRHFLTRWSAPDYPGADPRFQAMLLGKDIAVYILLPVIAVVLFKACESAARAPRKAAPRTTHERSSGQDSHTQVIVFPSSSSVGQNTSSGSAPRRSPGTLIRLKLLNVVETYSNTPVHAQIVDNSLGPQLYGGTLIGDATPDTNFSRINISFRFVRDPRRAGNAFSVSARALSPDGTLGVVASKKEGAFTRSVFNGASTAPQTGSTKLDNLDLKDIVIKALSAGLLQELGSTAQVERNRAQVLTLPPSTEFFAELTDFFPGAAR